MSTRIPLMDDIHKIVVLDETYFIIPAIDLNLNQALIQDFFNLCNDKEILKLIDEEFHNAYRFNHAKQFLKTSILEFGKKRKTYYLMDRFIVGVFEFKELSNSPEIGYFLKKSLRGRGIGKLFVSKMIQFYSKDYDSLIAKVHKENLASLRILKGLGFRILHSKEKEYILKIEST